MEEDIIDKKIKSFREILSQSNLNFVNDMKLPLFLFFEIITLIKTSEPKIQNKFYQLLIKYSFLISKLINSN